MSVAEDLARIRGEGAMTLVSLVEEHEFRHARVDDFRGAVTGAGLEWCHLPIPDFGVPGSSFEEAWQEAGPGLRWRLAQGGRVVLHCYAGLGRTGLVAARLLIEFGEPPLRAIALVRTIRPGAIQSSRQEAYLVRMRHHRSQAGDTIAL